MVADDKNVYPNTAWEFCRWTRFYVSEYPACIMSDSYARCDTSVDHAELPPV